MANGKFYLLYNNRQQEKLLTMAENEEVLKEETEYYLTGVWFSYDMKENSNMLENEKEVKGIKFPQQAKERKKLWEETKNINFKWVA